MPMPEGWRRFWRITGQVFLLLAVGLLSAVTAMRFAIQGRTVTVPNVVGMTAQEAQQALAARGLGMRVADRVFSEQAADRVVRQSPAAGMSVKSTQRAHVVLSLGPQGVSIPSLEGKSLRVARVEILRAGLQLGEITQVRLEGQPADSVLQQNPPPLATNVSRPRVSLLVSLGPEEPSYVMPDLTGLSLQELPSRMNALGLKMGRVVLVPSVGLPRGTVVGTVPARGARVQATTAVEIQVVGDTGE
jgi:beta-lactam-binding protein with PASTA domain